ncbi:MAG: muconate cycloisomerase [Armatimonadetes bacterium]|nr:muconate cycloisomerase [Armatimonadota bacterium]
MAIHRISRIDVLPASLPVKSHEDSSRGHAQQHVFLRLETDGGAIGWGEARALPSWTGETLEAITAALRNYFTPVLLGINPFARNAVFRTLDEFVTGALPATKAAVDMALHDLQGKIADVPVHELFGGRTRDRLPLSHSVRADNPAAMGEAARRHHDSRCLKVKVTGDPGLDAERLAAVVEGAPQCEIWLDANQSYTPTSALQFLERIRSSRRVACLQQPVQAADWLGMARLRERSFLPLAVDEGFNSATDVPRLAQLQVADLVVLKLCKSGGLRDLLQAADAARLAGLDLLGSGLTESGVGLAAAVHVFSVLSFRLPAQLNGPQYLQDLCVAGLEIDASGIKVPTGPGLGVEVDEERIRAHAIEV